MYLHFKSVNASDYFERRDLNFPRNLKMARYGASYRLAHINMCLAMREVVRAAGPSPDGTGAEVFYAVENKEALEDLLRDDPYVIGRIWTSWGTRRLIDLVEPTTQVPVCLDGSRRVTAIEVAVRGRQSATAALERLRDEGSLAVGGVTDDGVAIAWIQKEDREKAIECVKNSGLDMTEWPRTHAMFWVL